MEIMRAFRKYFGTFEKKYPVIYILVRETPNGLETIINPEIKRINIHHRAQLIAFIDQINATLRDQLP